LTLEDGTDNLSRNVGKKLQLLAVLWPNNPKEHISPLHHGRSLQSLQNWMIFKTVMQGSPTSQ